MMMMIGAVLPFTAFKAQPTAKTTVNAEKMDNLPTPTKVDSFERSTPAQRSGAFTVDLNPKEILPIAEHWYNDSRSGMLQKFLDIANNDSYSAVASNAFALCIKRTYDNPEDFYKLCRFNLSRQNEQKLLSNTFNKEAVSKIPAEFVEYRQKLPKYWQDSRRNNSLNTLSKQIYLVDTLREKTDRLLTEMWHGDSDLHGIDNLQIIYTPVNMQFLEDKIPTGLLKSATIQLIPDSQQKHPQWIGLVDKTIEKAWAQMKTEVAQK